MFARLFPGGAGRLVLTDPENMLTTGIEVEARPPGKKIKRLSLLSGGERSLTAVAFLVSLFQARPSPFYVLDEVEAALDDVNLGRLLDVLEELRENSQLIVITHQKRTMEIADALYGVSMRGDGVTHVISQRLRERQAGCKQGRQLREGPPRWHLVSGVNGSEGPARGGYSRVTWRHESTSSESRGHSRAVSRSAGRQWGQSHQCRVGRPDGRDRSAQRRVHRLGGRAGHERRRGLCGLCGRVPRHRNNA